MTNAPQNFLGVLVLSALPALLLIDDSSLLRFVVPYCLILFPFVLVTTKLISIPEITQKSEVAKTIILLNLAFPFILFAAYPFAFFDMLMSLLFILLGIGLPFWSIKLTWWLYTLGGRVPLPKEHNWLLGEKNTSIKNNNAYTNFIKDSGGIAISIGLIIFYFINGQPVTEVLLVMKVLSMIILLGLSLTIATNLKKKLLLK